MTVLSVLYLLKLENVFTFTIVAFTLASIDLLMFVILRKHYKSQILIKSHWALSASVLISLILIFFVFNYKTQPYDFTWVYYYSGSIFSIYVAKIFFLLLSTLCLSLSFWVKKTRIFLKFTLLSSIFIFFILLYGMLWGRFDFEIIRNERYLKELPKSFDSLRIVQISDLHIGVFPGYENKFQELIDSVNSLKPDLVFITGDILNSFAEELNPFVPILQQIQSKFGTFGVLGNHDYGDYYRWKHPEDQLKNQILIKALLLKSNVKLLNNENITISHNNDTIWIAGIENWGLLPYRQEGNLVTALKGIPTRKLVLLLSHDPVFWEKEVLKHEEIMLCFSGHTHGMQIGLRFFNKEWSPFAIGKKYCSGWYYKGDQHLYINKGIGGSLYPGRVGIRPEISLFIIRTHQP